MDNGSISNGFEEHIPNRKILIGLEIIQNVDDRFG